MAISLNSYLNGWGGAERPPIAKTIGGEEPNWKMIPSKSTNTIPKKAMFNRAKELGEMFVNATTDQERQQISDEAHMLILQYSSTVSPDRKTLYKNALKEIKKQTGGSKQNGPNIDTTKTLIDYLNEHDGKGKVMPFDKSKGMQFDRPYHLAGGGSIVAIQQTGGGANFIIRQNGQEVMYLSSDGKLSASYTDAEHSKMKELCDYYYSVIDNARLAAKNTQTSQGGIDISV